MAWLSRVPSDYCLTFLSFVERSSSLASITYSAPTQPVRVPLYAALWREGRI
jgi:hypothetical protein